MKRSQIRTLIRAVDDASVTTLETRRRWFLAIIDALSETDGDVAFESLRRRFSRKYGRRLGGCTERLEAATTC